MPLNRVESCDACHRSLVWLKHYRTGNVAPIEFKPPANDYGNVIPVDEDGDPAPIASAAAYRIRGKGEPWNSATQGPLYLNHFATCREAGRFHRDARAPAAREGKATA